jgi:hypothetical protein
MASVTTLLILSAHGRPTVQFPGRQSLIPFPIILFSPFGQPPHHYSSLPHTERTNLETKKLLTRIWDMLFSNFGAETSRPEAFRGFTKSMVVNSLLTRIWDMLCSNFGPETIRPEAFRGFTKSMVVNSGLGHYRFIQNPFKFIVLLYGVDTGSLIQ